jgi:autotransporter-associated beta strand protein
MAANRRSLLVKNKFRFVIGTAFVLSFLCPIARSATVTFTLATPGTYNMIDITTSVVTDSSLIGTLSDSETPNATGSFAATINSIVDPATHQISAPTLTFVEQTPGAIALSPMTFHVQKSIIIPVVDETVQTSTLLATPKTPSPPTTLTPASGGFTFPMTSTQLIINQGTITASGTTSYNQDCATSPITTSMESGDGTLTFNKTTDTLSTVVYTMNLRVPVAFNKTITTGTISVPIVGNINYSVGMSGTGTMDANSGSFTQNFTSAYWDTATSAGLQGGNGTWSTSNAFWSNVTTSSGANALYPWTADGGNLNAYFNAGGTSAIAVSGTVAAKSLTFSTTGNSFTGGTIAVGSGGITAYQSTSINSALSIAAAQSWNVSSSRTLAVGGNISAGPNVLTLKGAGTTSLSGTNSFGMLKIGDAASGNLIVAGGATSVSSGFDIVYGTAYLNGGTLAVSGISHSGSNSATFNFNGGTLQAKADNANFMSGLTAAYVRENGAKIDTQNFDVSIGQALSHGGASATDGGLLKTGGGTLTLAGALAYTGGTTISGGAIVIDNHLTTTLHAISGSGDLYVASGSTLKATSINVNALAIGTTPLAAAVPEPATMLLLAIAGIFGGFAIRRSRRG